MKKKEQIIYNKFKKNNFRSTLPWLNASNSTANIEVEFVKTLLTTFKEDLTILVVGSAYGGEVDTLSQIVYGRGKVYGYDTFEGHPKDLAFSSKNLEATCMNMWYNSDLDCYQKDKLTYEYQRKVLDERKLTNAILVKGRVNEHSFDDIEKAHLVMLDLDMIIPTIIAYNAIKDKIAQGGYIFFHDAVPHDHLPMIYHFVHDGVYKEVSRWDKILESEPGLLSILRRRKDVL